MPEVVVADLEVNVTLVGLKHRLPLCLYHTGGGVGIKKLVERLVGGLGVVKAKIVPRKEFKALWKKYGWK